MDKNDLEGLNEELERRVEQLEEVKHRYDLAVRATTDGVWDWNILTGEEFFAPRWCEIIGYTPDDPELEHTYEAWASRIHPEDRPGVEAAVGAHLETGATYDVTYRHRHRSGQYRWQNSKGQAVFDADGRPVRMVGAIRDVHEQREQEEHRIELEVRLRAQQEQSLLDSRLQQAQKLESLGVLAGGIAHDFNNLLVGVLGYADLALSRLGPSSAARPLIDEIRKGGERAADLCSQMLAYSGRGKFTVENVDVNQILADMNHLLEVSISKKVVLRYDCADSLPAISADATQIRQVVMNLVINAAEATGDRSGVISVSTGAMQCDRNYLDSAFVPATETPEGIYVFVEVSDTGAGMDADTKAKIFEPFFTTKFTGRGLGLAAVQGIVRGHAGAIKVYSEVGAGTTIKALFPAIKEAARTREDEEAGAEEWRGSGTVLLVDDDETVLAVGRMMLEEAGFDVLTAGDGRDGLAQFRERSGDIRCVILDLMMPHMDGEEAFRELRRIRPDVRVILSSGYNDFDVTSRFGGKGLAGFLKKPYRSTRLLETLRAALEKGGPEEDSP